MAVPLLQTMTDTTSATLQPPRELPVAPLDVQVLELIRSAESVCEDAADGWRLLDLESAAAFADGVEHLSRAVNLLQLTAAAALDHLRPADSYGQSSDSSASLRIPAGEPGHRARVPGRRRGEFRSTADFMRARLRIPRAEAKRRLATAGMVFRPTTQTGEPLASPYPVLADACHALELSGSGAGVVIRALEEARTRLTPEALADMEAQLTQIASRQDEDFLQRTARYWLALLDQERPPTEQELHQFQGIFPGRRRNGLNHVHIYCTDEQHEALLTLINGAAGPRAATSAGEAQLPRMTRPQRLLEGLLNGVRAGLACGGVPASGGLRPQVLVTISHESLWAGLTSASAAARGSDQSNLVGLTGKPPGRPAPGSAAFSGPLQASVIRRLACDADLIPVVLGTEGRVLDVGRAARLFPPHLRKALYARDRGCSFPGCSIPGPWTEAHHVTFWESGGQTGLENGALLCSFHHHTIHDGSWRVEMRSGVPWFIPPAYVDPQQRPLRNTYFHPGPGKRSGA